MNLRDSFRLLLLIAAFAGTLAGSTKECISSGSITSKLFCYYSDARRVDVCKCSHVILPETTPIEQLKGLIEEKGAKVLLTVREFNQNLLKTLNETKIFGLEVQPKKLSSKQDITDFISTVRTKLGADLFVALSVPAKPEFLAKYYDFKTLSKHADVFTLQTHFLGANRNVTFHPSRLSGLWDVQNTDSVVDLVTGLGAPLNKLVVATPVQGFKFLLQNEEHTAPGSPALELSTLTRDELCVTMESDKWMLERDQDQAGPYIFRKNKWIAFEDATSMDIKAKYARVRGLAGLALKDLSQDGGAKCGETLLESAFNGLTKQARAPRGAVLHSLEREILEPVVRPFDNVQVSPYRISRVIDTEGHVNVIRQDTRTEFKCSRQGYFVHPRSCNRFYRCVKFDQQSDEFSVFEFDCPAGLAFDERVEVCVWPGSLPDGAACAGSSEIAPVPRERFICPETPGYYADPENCRWFFACMDHGKSPLTAYEFRCPYGLVFDQDNLLCEWSWLVPKCGSGAVVSETVYGGYAAAGSISGITLGAGAGVGITGAGNGRGGSGSGDYSLEGRDGAFDLDLYDGLGSLNSIQLGGISGPLHATEAITYSNVGQSESGNGEYHENNIGAAGYTSDSSAGTLGNQYAGHGLLGGYSVDSSAGLAMSQNAGNGFNYQSTYYQGSNGDSGENIASGGVAHTGSFVGVNREVDHQGDALKYYNAFAANRFTENAAGFEYDQGHQLNQQHQHSINIVAGGASGVASYAKNVDILQHGVKIDVEAIQPATLVSSTTISPIPTVTTVPLPSTAHVNTYNNYGVVANIPDLQYKLENPTIINHQLHQLGDINSHKPLYSASNVSLDYAGYAASNLDTVGFNGYHYEKPSVQFTEGQNLGFGSYEAKTYQKPQLMINEHQYNQQHLIFEQQPLRPEVMKTYTYEQSFNGYNYEKPKVAFVQGQTYKPAHTYQQVHVQQPSIAYHQVKHETDVKQQGYVYNKPTVAFGEEQSGYHYNKPAIKFESVKAVTPALTYQQIALQPATTYSEIQPAVQTYHEIKHEPSYVQPANVYQQVNHEVKHEGYHYEKPAIKFDEKPQPAATYQQVNAEVKHEGYFYEKPAIKFEEKPIVPITISQPQPAVTYQHVNHEIKQEGYHYDKPAIKFEEKPIVPITTYQEIKPQPTLTNQQVNHEIKHEGYHYEKPAIKFEEKPIVPVTTIHEIQPQPAVTYQEINREVQQGYHYKKPAIKFEEKPIIPVQTYHEIKPQPAVTYQQVNHEVKHEGYHYEKPAIKFEEKPIVPVTTYHEVKPQPAVTYQEINHEFKGYQYEKPTIKFEEKPIVPVTTYEVKPQPAVTYQQVNHEVKYEGYHYEKPSIKFEEKPIVPATTYPEINIQPAVTYQEFKVPTNPVVHVQHEVKQQGYHYEQPAIAFEEKPTRTYQQVNIQPVQTYQEIKHETPRVLIAEKPAPVVQEIKHEGYHYEKPKVVFEEKPVVPTTTYQQINIQPAVTYHETKHEGYHYEKPKVVFEEKPVATPTYLPPVNTYQEIKVAKPAVTFTHHIVQQPAIPSYSYQKPIVDQNIQTQSYHEIHHKPAVATYKEVKHEGYHYEKPKIVFEEKPAVTYQQITFPQPKPVVAYKETKQEGYFYEKPKVVFEEKPVIPSVSYIHHVQPQPTPILSTYHEIKPLVVEQKPTYKQIIQAVTPKPVITNSFSINQYSQGYQYNKPAIAFEEKPVVKVVPATPTYLPPRPVQVKINPALNYIPPRPAKTYIPAPTTPTPIVKEYLPQPVQTYLPAPAPTIKYVKPVQTYYQEYYDSKEIVEQPIVKTQAYQTGYHYEKPAIKFEYSTPAPTLASIISKAEPAPLKFVSYDSRFDYPRVQERVQKVETIKVHQPVVPIVPVVPVVQQVNTVTSKPIVRYEFSSLDYQPAQPVQKIQPVVQEKLLIHVPDREYLPVVSTTRRPVLVAQKNQYLPPSPPKRVYLPVTTTEKYVEVTSPSREYLPVTEILKIRTSTPAKEYLPVTKRVRTRPTTTATPTTTTTKPSREYIPVRSTKQPTREYLPVKSTTPSREYLPVSSTNKPNREYLPAKQIENYEYQPNSEEQVVLSTRRPKVIKVVKTRPIVKVNDFHPILSAKLGAQCTCTSNTLTLRRRKPQKSLKIQNDDDATTRISDEEEYITNEDQLDTRYDQGPKKQSVIIVAEEDEDISQDDEIRKQDIAKAVDSGLKLVKSAVKQGVKEGVQEALSSKNFDRYGPGGLRSRSETLQGTVDCQRAGLFRHPKHCNKFYACRWDEGKKKFTLHVFNCPVHLTFDNNLGACNWPSQGPACVDNTLLPSD